MPFPAIGDYGPYADWNAETEYFDGDVVFHKGYLYRLMGTGAYGDSSIGEDPKTATASYPFEDTAGINSAAGGGPYDYTEYRTLRRWCLFSLPNAYYQAMLRKLPPPVLASGSNLVDYVRTISAVGFKFDGEIADECSYAGYGFFAGLDVTYSIDTLTSVDNEVLVYSHSAVPMDRVDAWMGGQTYRDPTDNFSAVFWQPNTVGNGTEYPTWGDDCQGMMFSSMQTFGRDYTVLLSYDLGPPETSSTADLTTVSFQDNWTGVAVSSPPVIGVVLLTSPSFPEEV